MLMNDNPNIANSDSQAQQILALLEAGYALTADDAIERIGCYRLAARVKDLRDQGHQIETQLMPGINRDGKKIRYGQYRLVRGE